QLLLVEAEALQFVEVDPGLGRRHVEGGGAGDRLGAAVDRAKDPLALLAGMDLDGAFERAEFPAEFGGGHGIEPHRDDGVGDLSWGRGGSLGWARAAAPLQE